MTGLLVIFGTIAWVWCGIYAALIDRAWIHGIYRRAGFYCKELELDPVCLAFGPMALWISWDDRGLLKALSNIRIDERV